MAPQLTPTGLTRGVGGAFKGGIGFTFVQNFVQSSSLAESARVGPTLTFSRASDGTYFDSSGTLQTATTDEARFDHDLSDNSARGLLIEESRTNEALHNRDLTNAAWSKSNTTAAKDETGLDGSANSASSLTADANDGTVLQSISDASSEARTYSVYIKRVTGSGTIEITIDGGTAWTDITSTVDADTSAFHRVSVTKTDTNPSVGIRLGTSGDKIAVDYNQLEDGGFATSPIATTTSSVTRAAEACSTTDVAWFNNGGPGTFIAEYEGLSDNNFNRVYEANVGDTTTESIRIQLSSGNQTGVLRDDSSNLVFISKSWASETVYKHAFAFATNDAAVVLDGGAATTDSALTLPSDISDFFVGLGQSGGNRWLNGWVRRIRYTPLRLSNSRIQQETS